MREQEAEHMQQIAEAELELDKQQRQQRSQDGGQPGSDHAEVQGSGDEGFISEDVELYGDTGGRHSAGTVW